MAEPKQYRPTDYEAKEALDGKTVEGLSPAMNLFITSLFPMAKSDDVVHCELCDNYEKPDLRIEVGDEVHFISLKSGGSKSLHYESIKGITLFLRSLGVSVQTQKTLLLFHYGDGTLDGTGETRLLREDVMEKYKAPIEKAMIELNRPQIVRACLKRFIFEGSEKRVHAAEFLAFGDPTTFLTVSKDEVFDFVMRQRYDYIRSFHVGPMIFAPWKRNVERVEEDEWKRGIVHVVWPYLLTDIQKMLKRRNRS